MNTESAFPKTPANYAALSPVSFLRRASGVFPSHPAVIYGDRRYAWRDVHDRACRLANALRRLGIKEGDTVSLLAANTPRPTLAAARPAAIHSVKGRRRESSCTWPVPG